MATEADAFIKKPGSPAPPAPRNKCLHGCCVSTAVIGAVLVGLGLVVVFLGGGMLQERIRQSMALVDGSKRYESWLRPPVQPHLYGYAFNIKNPDQVLRGAKPIVEEKGPYVYKSTTVKDSDDNVVFHSDSTISYRPRKVYTYEPSLSGPGLDPHNDWVTVPNIPLWTGLNGIKDKSGVAKGIGRDIVTNNGRGTPFVNVTFNGLLWGYPDELPCLKLSKPSGCASDDAPFSSSDDDSDWGDEEEDSWMDDFRRRKKRQADDPHFNPDKDQNSEWYGLAHPKAEFVNCSCEWGLFRDRNITMRKPIRFLSGVSDLSVKGVVTEYDHKTELGWWEEGSQCDKVKGQDSSTLPPSITKEHKLDIFISLMCRTMPMVFEKEVVHADINTYRFIPPKNAMGAHDDPDPEIKNTDNQCYCMKSQGYTCFKSGVLNMEPCKRDTKAPLALSMPHFYQADPSFLEAVEGLNPQKEKHEFYIDAVPEFGFPLAIRPRFQLNVVIGKAVDPDWTVIAGMRDEIVMPFLWAQDGFDEPSVEMSDAIAFGLSAPQKLPLMIAVALFVIGAAMLAAAIGYFVWNNRKQHTNAHNGDIPLKAI